MVSRWAAAVALLFTTAALSGCVGGLLDVGSGVRVSAPDWQAGYSWTYEVHSESMFGYSEGDDFGFEPEDESTQITYRVTNTSEPLAGEDVYYVSASDSLDAPLRDSHIQALTKDNLQLVGQASYYHSLYAVEPVEVSPPAMSPDGYPAPRSSSYHYTPPDPCAGRVPIEPIPEEEQVAVPRFPLESGRTWSGTWMVEDDFGFYYTAEVHEPRRITVPAGTFEAIPVVVDLRPTGLPFADEGAAFDMDIQLQNWYSPEVQWDVKSVFAMRFTGSFGDEKIDARQKITIELLDHSLAAEPEEPAPYVRNETAYRTRPSFDVVTDTAFPVNLAEGHTLANFTLDGGPTQDGYYGRERLAYASPYAREMPYLDDLSRAAGPDTEQYDIVWRLLKDGELTTQTNGTSFSYDVAEGGSYDVRAYVVPKECGIATPSVDSGRFNTFWEKTFAFDVGLGLDERSNEQKFPVDRSYAFGSLEWVMEADYSVSPDSGHPVVTDPRGDEMDGPEDYYEYDEGRAIFFPDRDGQWSVAWQADGAHLGHSAKMTLRIDYGSGPFPFY